MMRSASVPSLSLPLDNRAAFPEFHMTGTLPRDRTLRRRSRSMEHANPESALTTSAPNPIGLSLILVLTHLGCSKIRSTSE
eukprot:12393290-Alexandrium_andersonii.AAC.1